MSGDTHVMHLSVGRASEGDVPALAALRSSVSQALTRKHGRGHWSSCPTEKSVLRGLETSRVLVARDAGQIVGTIRLAAKKPWAIDARYFSVVQKPIYLHDLVVAPERQREGIGRLLVQEAKAVTIAWPAHAIRLDAYDHAAGAGEFHARCGFRRVGRAIYRGVPLLYFELLL